MRTAPALARPPRNGLSVVEVLVALMLLTVGLMGIAGSSALALRSTLDAARRREAAERAASRLARLTAGGCARAVSGTDIDTSRHIQELWRVTARTNGFQTISDSVDWTSLRGHRSLTLTTAIPC